MPAFVWYICSMFCTSLLHWRAQAWNRMSSLMLHYHNILWAYQSSSVTQAQMVPQIRPLVDTLAGQLARSSPLAAFRTTPKRNGAQSCHKLCLIPSHLFSCVYSCTTDLFQPIKLTFSAFLWCFTVSRWCTRSVMRSYIICCFLLNC